MENYNEVFRQRTKELAKQIVFTLSDIKYSDALSIMRNQLIRCSTSVAANYRAVCRSRSLKEKFAKLCIVVEESDESIFWLDMLHECNFITKESYDPLFSESQEILNVMSAYKKKVGQELR